MFWAFLLICIVAWIVVSIVKEFKPVSPEAIAKMQQEEIELANRMREGTEKKEEYFKWLNENYSISKIFDFKNYYFKHASGWADYERRIIAIDEQKKVVIFGRREVAFENIISCELLTNTSYSTTTTTEKENGIGRAVVGGIIAGGAGAVVGATTANLNSSSATSSRKEILGLRIYVADINLPEILYRYGDFEPSRFQEIHSTMLAIIALNNKQ